MVRILLVGLLEGFRVRLGFTDNTEKVLDLEPYLRRPIFEPMRRNLDVFRSVVVDQESGTIAWPNGADMDPDVLYGGLTPAWMDNMDNQQEQGMK